MHEKVAWLVERLEASAPRDDLRTVDEALANCGVCFDARTQLNCGGGMVLGLSVSDCYPEVVAVLEPTLGRLLDEWERFLRDRFGEDAVERMQIMGGMTPSLDWWLGAAERQLDAVLQKEARAGTLAILRLRLQLMGSEDVYATVESLHVVITPPGTYYSVVPAYRGLATRRLREPRDLEALWRGAREIVRARASLSSLDVGVELTGAPERQWAFVAAAFTGVRPRHIRFTAWPPWVDRGPEPGGCSCNVVLDGDPESPEGEDARGPGSGPYRAAAGPSPDRHAEPDLHRVAVAITSLDPPDDVTRGLHRWAQDLARASGIVLEAVWK